MQCIIVKRNKPAAVVISKMSTSVSRMNGALIDIIAGARPNFMKIAPIIRRDAGAAGGGQCLVYRLVHTGQHYDGSMSGDFFASSAFRAPT